MAHHRDSRRLAVDLTAIVAPLRRRPPDFGFISFSFGAHNLAVARRHAPVLAALYTSKGNIAGARMSRGLESFADRVNEFLQKSISLIQK